MTNPLADPYLVLKKVYCNGTYLKQALADVPIEPLNKARTVKICYGVLERDVYLERVISSNVVKQPKLAVKIILKIALYMLIFMEKHDYMVIDCAVELTKKLGKDGAAGFVNALLRSYKLPDMPAGTDERLALEYSAPLWLVKKLRRSYKAEAAEILKSGTAGVCVRFERNLDRYIGIPHVETPFENVLIFENFTRDEGFFAGDYTFQSVGSVAIASAISPGERVLDACAAPGGKSVLLAKKFKNVISADIYPHRVQLIREYARRMGVENIEPTLADGRAFNAEYAEVFDAVLVDAPCSGTGVINENPDIKLFRKESDIAELAGLQLEILSNCSRYVKKGGRLYYSTCSVLPEENDSVVHRFLSEHREYAPIIPESPLPHKTTGYGLQFLPHISLGAGFYLTSFVKL